MNILIFIIIINILIFIHELGHFLAAKRIGVKVEKFSLGFGKKLFGFKFKDTDFYLCLIPFGGYVKLAGEGKENFSGKEWEYLSKSPGQRAKIIFAGPLFNYILAFLSICLVYFIGYPRVGPVVGDVIKGLPAEEAGIDKGDVIIGINGVEVKYWFEVLENIRDSRKEAPFQISIRRGEEELNFEIMPSVRQQKDIFGKERQAKLIGISPSGDIVYERYGFLTSFRKGLFETLEMTWMTLKSIMHLVLGYLSFREAVVGPVGIYQITSAAAQYGFNALLHMTAMLSLALAIFNILPIPILDGGHLMFLAIEKIRGRPLKTTTEEKISNVGLSFIIVLAIFIFLNDLVKFGYWDKLINFFTKFFQMFQS